MAVNAASLKIQHYEKRECSLCFDWGFYVLLFYLQLSLPSSPQPPRLSAGLFRVAVFLRALQPLAVPA